MESLSLEKEKVNILIKLGHIRKDIINNLRKPNTLKIQLTKENNYFFHR